MNALEGEHSDVKMQLGIQMAELVEAGIDSGDENRQLRILTELSSPHPSP